MAEVFAWPEASIYLYPTGGPSAVLAFGENVTLNASYDFLKFKNQQTGSLADRTKFVYAGKGVQMSVGMLHANQSAFAIANSATAFNAKIVLQVTGGLTQTAEYAIWSAVFTNFSLQGQDGSLFRASVTMEAADVSGI